MWDFSDDESFFFLVAAIATLVCAVRWCSRLIRVSPWVLPTRHRMLLAITPLVGLVCVYITLQHWSDPQVRGHVDYVLLFMLGAVMWLGISTACFGWLGLSVAQDAIQRANLASNAATSGGLLGVSLLYAGCNIGAGPTIWTTLVPAFVATVSLLFLWFIYTLVSGAHEAIAVDRDLASGLRLGGLLIAMGVILGGAMAGNFTTWVATFSEFVARASPALLLVALAVAIQRLARPTPERPVPSWLVTGALPVVAYLLVAILCLMVELR